MNPVVSIVTPAYRAAQYIGASIESVLGQTFGEFELLVVDDLSPDTTVAIVEAYVETDSRVRLLRHERNLGPAGARNTALAAARGRYIAFLDADDIWLPTKLERHIGFMHDRGSPFSYTQYLRINERGESISKVIGVPARLDYYGLLKNTAIATSTVIIDRERTGPFTMRNVYYDDFVCWLGLLKRGHVAHGFQEDLTRYRVVPASWSRNKLNSAAQVWKTYREIERLAPTYAAFVFLHYAWNAWRKYR